MQLAYEEFIDFLAAGTTPRSVVDFHPSEAAKSRVADLIQRQKAGGLSDAETAELQHFLQWEHWMRLAKAKAHSTWEHDSAMSVTYIHADLRRLVIARAEELCEYCLIAEEDTFLGCQVDHIISEKHGGPTTADNLAYACVFCNLAKGSDLGSLHWSTGELVRFFNPRRDRWAEHFVLSNSSIIALTAIGEVTARLLQFNAPDRLMERRALQAVGRYPSDAARRRLQLS